jgi:diaminopimelate decarboxylase
MPRDFFERTKKDLPKLLETFPTPFHLYDEEGIRATARRMKKAFSGHQYFKEFFAVKALPNPDILAIMQEEGFGSDCSSIPELVLARAVGNCCQDIMFTSNNTTPEEYLAARQGTPEYIWHNGYLQNAANAVKQGGCILNLDDITFIPKAAKALGGLPETICFRYGPRDRRRKGKNVMGGGDSRKYGLTREQIVGAFRLARAYGAKRFGLHCMIASNKLDYRYLVNTVKKLLAIGGLLKRDAGIILDFINPGGGVGIPYWPHQRDFNIEAYAAGSLEALREFQKDNGYVPNFYTECGRYMTGPHGVLVTRVINKMMKYKLYYGVDACASACPRPFIYDAYHGIIVPRLQGKHVKRVRADVVGSLCENADKFAHDRLIMPAEEGDIMLMENTGAHSWAMGSTYNARLRIAEVLRGIGKTAKLIRRAETMDDYFATLNFDTLSVKL